jgi:hypothetical protein
MLGQTTKENGGKLFWVNDVKGRWRWGKGPLLQSSFDEVE